MSLKPFGVAQDLVKQMAKHAKTMERGTTKSQDRDGCFRATPESNRARFWHLRVSQETFYRKISTAMQAADDKAYRWLASGRDPLHTVHRCENSVGVGPVALLLGCQPSERTSGTCTSIPQFFKILSLGNPGVPIEITSLPSEANDCRVHIVPDAAHASDLYVCLGHIEEERGHSF